MATVFSAPEIGSAESVGVKSGGIRAYDVDVIRPVSNLIRDEFSGSKQLEFRWRSDSSRFFSPKDTKLKVEYEIAFCKTAGSFADNTEHDMCRFGACPGMALFDGGLKYMCNNTLVENQTEPYTASMATLLMKTDVPSSDTSASGSLMTLRKDVNKSLAAPTVASSSLTGTVPEGTLTGGGTLPNGSAVESTDDLTTIAVSANGAGSAVGTLTVADLAAIMKPAVGTVTGFTGGGNERDGKADNLNPKQVALNLGYDSTSKHSTVEIAEPLIGLSSWSNGGYAIGPSDHQLFCTISPNYAVDVVFSQDGTVYNQAVGGTIPAPASAVAATIYVQINSVELLVGMISPYQPFIPRSVSLRWSGMQVSTRLLQSNTVNESIIIPSSTRILLTGMRQRIHGVQYDREELGAATVGRSEVTGQPVYGFTDFEFSFAGRNYPNIGYGDLDPAKGKMSRPFADYLSTVGKSLGLRASTLTYAEFCGFQNSNSASGAALGDRGAVFMNRTITNSGNLSNVLTYRAKLSGSPLATAQQELVCIAIYDNLLNIKYAPPASLPISTTVSMLT
eukprot:COSAG01_NODE_663_length_14420_cov_77.011382_6_plen_562_part_00